MTDLEHCSLRAVYFPFLRFAPIYITFDASVDKNTVSMNDTVMLQISVSGSNINVPRPSLPPIPGFQVYSSGQSQNYSIVNGQANSQVVYSYALAPQAPGNYTIPALTLQAGSRNLSTKPIAVQVVSGSAPPPGQPGQNPPATAAEPGEAPQSRRDIFLSPRTSTRKPRSWASPLFCPSGFTGASAPSSRRSRPTSRRPSTVSCRRTCRRSGTSRRTWTERPIPWSS